MLFLLQSVAASQFRTGEDDEAEQSRAQDADKVLEVPLRRQPVETAVATPLSPGRLWDNSRFQGGYPPMIGRVFRPARDGSGIGYDERKRLGL